MEEMLNIEHFNTDFDKLNLRYSEILRYMYSYNSSESCEEIINECIKECKNCFDLKAVYVKTPVKINDNDINFVVADFKSNHIAKLLSECDYAVIFGATIGYEIDRLIKKYSLISPLKALTFNAIGTEVIESLCGELCKHISKTEDKNITNRFSPGYGDFSIEYQKIISDVLSLQKNIGITLSEKLLMIPSKSVTGIIGIGKCLKSQPNYCNNCNMTNCKLKKIVT